MSCKGNVEKFCDDSTMHGFKELYYARNCVWKSFWTLVILGASAITCYQVYDSIMFYWKQPTIVNMHPMIGDIERPNLDFCFHNKYVYSWMTFDTGILNNETDQYFLHFLSKLTGLAYLDLYYSNYFNSLLYESFMMEKVTQTQIDLFKNDYNSMLVKNNVKNEIFYARRFIAKIPGFLITQKYKNTYFSKPIKTTFAGNYVCYSYALNGTNHFEISFPMEFINMRGYDAKLYTEPSKQLGLLTRNMLGTNYPEIGYYFYDIFNDIHGNPGPLKSYKDFGEGLAYTSVTLSNLVMFGIGDVQPFNFKPNTNYEIRLGVNNFKYLNSAPKPCTDENGVPSLLLKEVSQNNDLNSNYTCYNFCMHRKRNVSTCINANQAVGLQNDEELEVKLCEPPANVCSTVGCEPMTVDSSNLLADDWSTEVEDDISIDEECRMKCPKQCTQWVYSYNKENKVNPTTIPSFSTIDVIFPLSSSVFVSEEQNAYTWTSLIGNIGGLLGLWLGASLLSFLQTFYLLLCPPKNMVEEISNQNAVRSVDIQKSNVPSLQSNKITSFQTT